MNSRGSSGDVAFDFLYERGCLIHHELHERYLASAQTGSPLPTALQCAKLYNGTVRYLKERFPDEFRQGGRLYLHSQSAVYDYKNPIYSWSLPCREKIETILKHCPKETPILEIGSGTGLYSAILSHYRTVYPTDARLPYRYPACFMPPLLYPLEQSVPANPHSFILAVFPYSEMVWKIFSLASTGQTIAVILPPMAGMTRQLLLSILDTCSVQDRFYGFESLYERHRLVWNGFIVRKEKEWSCPELIRKPFSIFDNESYYDYEEAIAGRLPCLASQAPFNILVALKTELGLDKDWPCHSPYLLFDDDFRRMMMERHERRASQEETI